MPVDLASLVIKTEAVGAAATTAGLNNVTAAATRAELAANRLAASQARLAAAQASAQAATARAATAHLAHEAALARAARAATGTTAAANRMGATFRDVTRDMSAGFVVMNQGISGLPYALARVTGPLMLLAIAGVAAFVGIGAAIKKAIGVVDDFQVSLISIAAGLTNVAAPGQGSFAEIFERNKEQGKEMYRAITLEAVKHFATANEMMISYNKLVQFGYAVRLDEVAALGVLTDVIKVKTKGQGVERQLNTEIMALMQGQARAGSLLAQELKSRLGPGWNDLVDKHRRAGDLLQWMASLFPGIDAANKDILNTMDSQWATTKSLLQLLAIGGLQGVYQSIVDLMKDINAYLLEHEEIITNKLIAGWITIKNYAAAFKETMAGLSTTQLVPMLPSGISPLSTLSALVDVIGYVIRGLDRMNSAVSWGVSKLKELGKWILEILGLTTLPATWEILVDMSGLKAAWAWIKQIYDFVRNPVTWVINTVFGGEKLTRPDTSLAARTEAEIKSALLAKKGLTEVMTPTQGVLQLPSKLAGAMKVARDKEGKAWAEWDPSKFGPPKTITPPKVPEKGGGAAAGAEANRLMSLMDTIEKDIARLSEGKFAEIEANLEKTRNQIWKKKEHRILTEAEVEVAAVKRASLQKEKLAEEFNLKIANMSGDPFKAIQEELKKDLDAWGNTEERKLALKEAYGRKMVIAEINVQNEIINVSKSYLDTMAGLATMLESQLGYKEKSLELENKLALAAIDKTVAEKPYLGFLKDEMVANQALIKQAKEYALEREKWMLTFSGGLKAGAFARAKETETRDAQLAIDAMKGVEDWLGDAGAQAFVDALHSKKGDLGKLFEDLGDSLIKQLFKMGTTRLFDKIWAGVGEALGIKAEPKLGTRTNPMVVTLAEGSASLFGGAGASAGIGGGFDRTKLKMEKTGYSTGGSSWDEESDTLKDYQKQYNQFYRLQLRDIRQLDRLEDREAKENRRQMGGYIKLKEQLIGTETQYKDIYKQYSQEIIAANQERFNQEYISMDEYQTGFSNMATNVTSIWGLAQGLMTMAGVEGEAARYGTMVAYGMQGISLLMQIAKARILVDAYQGAASAYKWVMEMVPWPINMALAPAAAAITFAAIAAYGAMGGVTSGFGGGGSSGTGAFAGAQAYHSGGLIRAHGGWPGLASDEVPIVAQTGERILSRGQNRDYEAGVAAGGGGVTTIHYAPVVHAIDSRGVDKVLEKHGRAMMKGINEKLKLRGRKL